MSGPMVGARVPKLTDVAERLAAMDAQGVDRQWVSASPNHFYPWAPEGLAVWIASEANRLIADARRPGARAADRARPRAAAASDPHRSSASTTRCSAVGSRASRSRRSPAMSSCRTSVSSRSGHGPQELGAVVFLHPFGCSLDERLDRFYLSNTVGQPAENAVALSHLIFSGVLDRHPGLKIVAAHGGGYLPFAIGRSDHAWRVRPEAQRLRARAVELPAQALVRHRRARRARAASSRRGRRGARGCCSAATSPSTWASTIR